MKLLIAILGQTLLVLSCSSASQKSYSSIRGFNLSNDNQHIYYSFVAEKQSSIRRYDMESGLDTVLLQSATDEFHTQPQLSPSQSHLAFIESNKNDFFDSKIVILDISTLEVEYLKVPKGILSDILYSEYSHQIYFLLAKEYEHYSPIGIDAAHRFDLYSINLNTKETAQLTQKGAYSMQNIVELDSLSISFFLVDEERQGIFEINIDSPNKIIEVIPQNDVRTNFYVYGKNEKPVYGHLAYEGETSTMALVCAYELFVMDRTEMVAKSVLVAPESGHFADIHFFHGDENKILFTKVKKPYFYVLNTSDSSVYEFNVLDIR